MVDKQKIERMRAGGKKLARIRDQIHQAVKPNVALSQLDKLAEKLMREAGGEPGFQLVPGYHWATCINVNEGIVHGIPHPHVKLQTGDLVSLDMGLYYQGFHTDTSVTTVAGKASKSQQAFLTVGKTALKKALAQATVGNRVGHISTVIQTQIEKAGFNCVRNLTGHGIGKDLHEPPMIPCVLKGDIARTPKLRPDMTLAIEVIYVQGKPLTQKLSDSWTIVTQDREPAGLFEETVLITKKGPEILTR